MAKKKTTDYGSTPVVLSILGLLFWFMPYFGIILSVLATLFSKKQMGKERSGSYILGIIGIVVNSIMLFFVLIYTLLFLVRF